MGELNSASFAVTRIISASSNVRGFVRNSIMAASIARRRTSANDKRSLGEPVLQSHRPSIADLIGFCNK